MRKAIPVLGILLFIAMVITSCGRPYSRPYGRANNHKGYHYRKKYKTYKPTYTNPRRVIHYKKH